MFNSFLHSIKVLELTLPEFLQFVKQMQIRPIYFILTTEIMKGN